MLSFQIKQVLNDQLLPLSLLLLLSEVRDTESDRVGELEKASERERERQGEQENERRQESKRNFYNITTKTACQWQFSW